MHADVWRQHHDELAGFMAAMAPDGAAQAVNLTGLTLKGEMDMALRIGQYRCVLLYGVSCCTVCTSLYGWYVIGLCALPYFVCASQCLIAI